MAKKKSAGPTETKSVKVGSKTLRRKGNVFVSFDGKAWVSPQMRTPGVWVGCLRTTKQALGFQCYREGLGPVAAAAAFETELRVTRDELNKLLGESSSGLSTEVIDILLRTEMWLDEMSAAGNKNATRDRNRVRKLLRKHGA